MIILKSWLMIKQDEDSEKRFDSLIKKYTIGFKTSMRGGDLFFGSDHLLYNKCHNINPNRGGSYADSPDWIKNKKASINPTNKNDNKCFLYAVTVTLNHEEIEKCSERITKIKFYEEI